MKKIGLLLSVFSLILLSGCTNPVNDSNKNETNYNNLQEKDSVENSLKGESKDLEASIKVESE